MKTPKTILKIYNSNNELINTFELDNLSATKALINILIARVNGNKKDNKLSLNCQNHYGKCIKATAKRYYTETKYNIYDYVFQGDILNHLDF